MAVLENSALNCAVCEVAEETSSELNPGAEQPGKAQALVGEHGATCVVGLNSAAVETDEIPAACPADLRRSCDKCYNLKV